MISSSENYGKHVIEFGPFYSLSIHIYKENDIFFSLYTINVLF
jgi:hypothetical protein